MFQPFSLRNEIMEESTLSPYEQARLKNIREIKSFMYENGLKKTPPTPPRAPTPPPPLPVPAVKSFVSKKKPKLSDEVNFAVDTKTETNFERRSLRPRKKVDYTEEIVPNSDDFIFCDACGEEFFEGCSLHPAIRNEDKNLVIVNTSTIKNAGRGVFNNSSSPIPVGTLFGPYGGKIIKPADYDKGTESGYAWELMDPDKKRVIGYVDPGSDPDPQVDWLPIVNSANYARDQNIVAVQVKGQNMYRVCRTIPAGAELLTYYGDEYARSLKIDPKQYKHGVGHKEHWDKLATNIMNDRNKHFCEECGQTFSTKAHKERHIRSIHQGQFFSCPTCCKRFTQKAPLVRHIKTVHEKEKKFDCKECGKAFGQKGHLNTHISTVHMKRKPHECPFCEMKFGRKGNLNGHIRNLHLKEKAEAEEAQFKHACSTCNKRFRLPEGLQLHRGMMHKKEE